MSGVGATAIIVNIRAGSFYENEKNWGASHLLEHLTFDATKSFSKEIDIELFKENYCIHADAVTSGEYIEYWFKFPSNSAKEALFLLEEIIYNPALKEKDFVREKKIVNQEYIDRFSTPHGRFMRSIHENIFGINHPYSRYPIGTPKTVDNLKIDDLEKIHKKHFTNENTTVVVAGKIIPDLPKKLIQILKKRNIGKKELISPPPITSSGDLFWHKEDVDQFVISLSWITNKRFNLREKMLLNVANYIIGGSARSLLFKKLRMEEGLVYSTGSEKSFYPTCVWFEAYSYTRPKFSQRVYKIMLEIIKEFSDKKINNQDFKRAINYLNKSTLLRYDSVNGIASELSEMLFYEQRIILPQELIKMTNSFTEEEVRMFFKKIISRGYFYPSVMSRNRPCL